MSSEPRSTRNSEAFLLDYAEDEEDEPNATDGTADFPINPSPLRQRNELSQTPQDYFAVPTAQQEFQLNRQRSSANIAGLSPDDARAHLPPKHYGNGAAMRPINRPLFSVSQGRSAPFQSSSPNPLQQQTPIFPLSTISSPFYPTPLALNNPPPRLPSSSSSRSRSNGEIHARASLMGVTGLDLSGEEYKGLDSHTDPFDTPAQNQTRRTSTPLSAHRQLGVRNRVMNGTNSNGRVRTPAVRNVGRTGSMSARATRTPTVLAPTPVRAPVSAAFLAPAPAPAPIPALDIAGQPLSWAWAYNQYRDGAIVDIGESAGWGGMYGVPPHLRNGTMDTQDQAAQLAVTAEEATINAREDTLREWGIEVQESTTPPDFEQYDLLSSPVLTEESDDDIMKKYSLAGCTLDPDGGIRAPEMPISEERADLEWHMRARKYWVDGKSGSARHRDMDFRSGTVTNWE